jgi:hypothetical protein
VLSARAVRHSGRCVGDCCRGQLKCDGTREEKPDFVSRRNGRVNINRRGRQFSRLLGTEMCASAFIVGSNAGYTMFRGSVKGTNYLLHSPVSPSLPLPCVTVWHRISGGVYPFQRRVSGDVLRRLTRS